jgi:hypothetical protein
MKNKSTLAKLLAEEDVFVIHKQMETAYFDSKKRELGLPIWKDEEMTEDIYDLMVCHEIGHALWTPLDMLETAASRKINHSFVNIIEDARIEKFVKNKYPGALSTFNRGYNDLIKKNFFGTNGKDVNSFNLIDRINLFFKGNSTVTFSDEEKVWVDRVAKTKTPDEVLDLSEELYAWMGETDSDEDDSSGTSDDESGDSESGQSESGDNESAGSDESGNSNEGKDDDENADDSGSNMASSDNSDCDTDDDSADTDALKGSEEGGKNSSGVAPVPEATTDSAFGKAMDEMRDKIAEDRVYAKIPKVALDKVIISPKTLLEEFVPHYLAEKEKHGSDYWDNILEKVKTLKDDSKNTVSYMVKEFEMKKAADAYARAAVSKTGSLDMNKIHTYKYNEDLFKKVTTLPGATNHGMVMVLDWSGSMHENLLGTLAQTYNLIWFCRRIKIPFEVFAFSDRYDSESRRGHFEVNEKYFKAGDLALNRFKLMNFFSSNTTISDEMSMMHTLWMYAASMNYSARSEMGSTYMPPRNLYLGGTPLNDAIIAMMELVPKFKKETGVQKVNTIFLTDGASNRLPGVYDYNFDKEENTHTEVISHLRDYHKSKIILTDPVMNKTYEIKNMTNDLLRILKNRVPEMNVVGFFIAGTGRGGKVNKRTLYYLLPKDSQWMIMEKIKFLNKNNYLALDQLGYDEYYVLPGGNSLKVENETLDDELIGASKAKLKTAFGKMSKGKVSSRQLLNKFVKMVA